MSQDEAAPRPDDAWTLIDDLADAVPPPGADAAPGPAGDPWGPAWGEISPPSPPADQGWDSIAPPDGWNAVTPNPGSGIDPGSGLEPGFDLDPEPAPDPDPDLGGAPGRWVRAGPVRLGPYLVTGLVTLAGLLLAVSAVAWHPHAP